MSELPAVKVTAPAKLNLALAVGGRGADGMHAICSWMVTIDLCDELTVTRLEPDRLPRFAILWHRSALRKSDIDWPITRDLAVRAHQALEMRVGRRLPVQLKLDKRIPVGGGLGGGSSDAAAMLRAVNRLYELGLGDEDLREIAAGLGSDVPFFVTGGSAIVEGLGERIEPLARLEPLHAVVVLPGQGCPTGLVYGSLDALRGGAAPPLRAQDVRTAASFAGVPAPETLFNDLTEAALAVSPPLAELLARLSGLAERPAQLAGSGSSLFALCDSEVHAEHLARAVESQLDLPAVAVRTVSGSDGVTE